MSHYLRSKRRLQGKELLEGKWIEHLMAFKKRMTNVGRVMGWGKRSGEKGEIGEVGTRENQSICGVRSFPWEVDSDSILKSPDKTLQSSLAYDSGQK
ncbi:hypothetical protein V6N12_069636 [Hibiscus sabdariffa]|uniref:Uncharacterized protein n=1 Tax=Hibiscus sabdariffa TaxID=183260 RepID=A0ABR2FEW0_9ROSI